MKKILLVSDTHAAYDVLEAIVSLEKDVDLIIHSGDFANIDGWDKSKQQEALEVFERTIAILKRYQKPIICVPGNVITIQHDAEILFDWLRESVYCLEEVFILGTEPVEVSGIRFFGLGGAPPGLKPDGSVAFVGFPYRTHEECNDMVSRKLPPQVGVEKSILVTHFPPFDIGKLPFRGCIAEAGSVALERFIEENSEKLILTISGHLHIQHWIEDYKRVGALNSGSVMLRNYAVFFLNENRVDRAELKAI